MKKRFFSAIALVIFSVATVHAGTVPINTDFLGNLVGGNPVTASGFMLSPVSSGNLVVDVYSRAYTGDNGLYAYLYQVDNTGVAGNSSVEMLTLWPFAGATDATDIGYLEDLSGTVAGDFLDTAGAEPEDYAFVDVLPSGPEVSFYFTKRFDKEIPPGEHSRVLYVMSELAPDVIHGNVINGSVGTGPVVGPVPEPATWIAMLGGLLALGFIRNMRRR